MQAFINFAGEAANDARRRWEDNIEERVQQSNNLLQQMHQMIADKFAGDNIGPRIDNLVNVDVPPFPQMSPVTAMDQLGGDVAPVESAVPKEPLGWIRLGHLPMALRLVLFSEDSR